MQRQHVDDVGPLVAPSVAIAEQLRGDRGTVGLVVDQDAAEGVAGEWVEGLEKGAEIVVAHLSGRGGTDASKSLRIRIAAL